MARDRQRAKQRRAKRQPGAGGPAAGSASTNPRDIGLDQAGADDAGLGNTTPPEPTKHGMPTVEEAHMAEAGASYEDELGPDDGAPDEGEGDLVGQATAVVLGFVVVAGAYLGLADVGAKQIIDFIL